MGNECEEWKKRALDAERERDEAVASNEKALRIASDARDIAERRKQEVVEANAARERAEADTVVLVRDLTRIVDAANATMLESRGERVAQFDWDPIYFAEQTLSEKHPGAALLAEVEALRRSRVTVLEYIAPVLGRGPSGLKAVCESIADLLSVDALKENP